MDFGFEIHQNVQEDNIGLSSYDFPSYPCLERTGLQERSMKFGTTCTSSKI
jgi:hypothetical protein